MSAHTSHTRLGQCPLCGADHMHSIPAINKYELTFLVKENKKFIKIRAKDIEVIEGMKDYIKIYVKNKIIITHMTMNKFEEMLDKQQFWRINRSFIIRKSSIASITCNTVEMSNKMVIPVGVSYRDFIKDIINTGLL